MTRKQLISNLQDRRTRARRTMRTSRRWLVRERAAAREALLSDLLLMLEARVNKGKVAL